MAFVFVCQHAVHTQRGTTNIAESLDWLLGMFCAEPVWFGDAAELLRGELVAGEEVGGTLGLDHFLLLNRRIRECNIDN